MNKFERDIRIMERIRDRWDDHVWTIFSLYIKAKGINFNGANFWLIKDSEEIHFERTDGCRGCYDPMALIIPMRWFVEENTTKILEDEIAAEKLKLAKEAEQRQKNFERRERAEFERLRSKFDP